MELHIKDRIYIPQMLPQQNSFLEYNIKRSIIQKIGLTAKDKETYDIQEDRENGRITWDIDKDNQIPLIVDLTNEELHFMQKSCEQLTDASYPDDFWAVVEKIYDAANK